MIQELLGGSATPKGLLSEGKTSSNPFSSPLLTTNSSICTTTMMSPSNNSGGANNSNNNSNSNSNGNNSETNNSNQQNLRCPRCDSTNTKFCYYNNYNLTQPRHFCKTCRRYWTKGGTLRNVPIGGGCRKNKSTISSNQSSSAMSKCSTPNNFMAKTTKATFSSEMLANDNSLFLGTGFMDHSIHSPGPNSLPWSSSLPQSQNSHILALIRGSTPFSNPNPNNNPNPSSLGLDLYGNGAPSLLGSFTRGNQQHLNGFGQDYVENNGINGGSNILDLYQKLKSSTNYGYCASNENPVILGHMVGSTPSSSSSMNTSSFDAASFGGGGGRGDHLGSYGFMGSTPGISSWSDFPAVPINGAYP